MPIRLLFLINYIPLVDLFKKHREKVPYASGNFKSIGKVLNELDTENEDEVEDDEDSKKENPNVSGSENVNRHEA